MDKVKILIIEDEEAIADLLAYGLNKEGFLTTIAHTGADGLRAIELLQPDMLLLDWMLPDVSGLDICKKVTETRNIPIIMLTAKSDITDKIVGLEFGADDYITKPFDLREVIARIRTILRRMTHPHKPAEEPADEPIRFKNIEITESERLVRKNNEIVDLTPKEFELLMTLYRHRGKNFYPDGAAGLRMGLRICRRYANGRYSYPTAAQKAGGGRRDCDRVRGGVQI